MAEVGWYYMQKVAAPVPMPSRRTVVIAIAVAAFFGWWGLRAHGTALPAAGPVVWVGADGAARAVRQVFLPGVTRVSALVVRVRADAPTRLAWAIDLAPTADPLRRARQVAAGAVAIAAGQSAYMLRVDPPAPVTGREATVRLWFDGPGASGARLESSGLDAYPGRFDVAGASRFGDLRLAVSEPNLYSDLRLRLSKAPGWLRWPPVHLGALVIFLAAITGFIADVTSARGEQG